MKGPVLQVMRICTRARIASVLALAVFATPAQAQDSTATPMTVDASGYRTHTVRAGETLWDIAHTYLGDGDLWPEIIRANRHLVQDPHWIFPNEVLRIPASPAGDGGTAIVAAPPAAAPAPASEAPSSTSTTAAAAPVRAPTTTSDVTPDAPATAADNAGSTTPGSTLFNHPPQTNALFTAARSGAMGIRAREGVHPGEHNGAPYIDRDGGPLHAGVLVGVVNVSSVIDAALVEHYSLHQDVYITMPLGSRPEVGAKFYTYELGPSFGDRGQIVMPTGIVTVITPGTGKVATTARITQLFGQVRVDEGVLPVDQVVLPSGPATPLSGGVVGRVVWVEQDQVLPTVGHYVLLDASAKTGVRLGDQFTLYRPRTSVPDGSVVLPESDIAIAQVVRVTPFGSSALILAQQQPAIEAGVAARVTARVP